MLAYIELLYAVEREAREAKLNSEQRRGLRQSKSRPILKDIKNYLQTERTKVHQPNAFRFNAILFHSIQRTSERVKTTAIN